jgi:hypothetical protein
LEVTSSLSKEGRDVRVVDTLIVIATLGETGESEERRMGVGGLEEVGSVHWRELSVQLRDIGVRSQLAKVLELPLGGSVDTIGSVSTVESLLILSQGGELGGCEVSNVIALENVGRRESIENIEMVVVVIDRSSLWVMVVLVIIHRLILVIST